MPSVSESEARELVEQGLSFPPFTVAISPQTIRGDATPSQLADWILTIDLDGITRKFAVEYKGIGGMASLGAAIVQARALAYTNQQFQLRPMVMMPYLSPEALDTLVREKVSGLDLCGNGVIYSFEIAPPLFAYRTGAKNRFPSSAPVKSPYRGDQSIVARAMFARGEFTRQKEIVAYLAECRVTPSTVSKVLRALEGDLVVARATTITVIRRDTLLDRLQQNYRPPKQQQQRLLRLALGPDVYQRIADNAKRLSIRYAASSPERYTTLPSSTERLRLFTSDATGLLEGLSYTVDERFPTLDVMEVESKLPFFGRTWDQGMWWCSLVQEYLMLASGGKREQEAARPIRASLLVAAASASGQG